MLRPRPPAEPEWVGGQYPDQAGKLVRVAAAISVGQEPWIADMPVVELSWERRWLPGSTSRNPLDLLRDADLVEASVATGRTEVQRSAEFVVPDSQ